MFTQSTLTLAAKSALRKFLWLHGAALVAAASGGTAAAQCESDYLHAFDGSSGDGFGRTLAVSDDRLLVGAMLFDGAPSFTANSGAAYVFEYEDGEYQQVANLLPPVPEVNGYFGRALDIDGDWAVVGAGDDQVAPNAGAGHLYRRGVHGWSYSTTLLSSDLSMGDNLGISCSLEGDRVVLGASGFGSATGSAYVFERIGTTWSEVAKLTPRDATGVSDFGQAVAVSGNRIAVAANGELDSIFVFDLIGGSWTQSARLAQLLHLDRQQHGQLGDPLARLSQPVVRSIVPQSRGASEYSRDVLVQLERVGDSARRWSPLCRRVDPAFGNALHPSSNDDARRRPECASVVGAVPSGIDVVLPDLVSRSRRRGCWRQPLRRVAGRLLEELANFGLSALASRPPERQWRAREPNHEYHARDDSLDQLDSDSRRGQRRR